MNKLLLALLVLSAGYFVFQRGEKKPPPPPAYPERVYPVLENRFFTFIIYASNHAAWCERSLASIFSQDFGEFRVIFIDDASEDFTYEKAQAFVLHAAQDGKVILMRNEKRLGLPASLYRAMDHCSDREIIIPLQAKDWLSRDDVLSRLNAAFQNPDVWLAKSQGMSYPEFQIEPSRGLFAFYASLLKTLPLSTFFSQGRIAMAQETYEAPLTQCSFGRIKSFPSPFLLVNRAAFSPSEKEQVSSPPSPPLPHFPRTSSSPEQADLLIFSYDRPLQLYALLESIQQYVSGASEICVLYRASDERYEAAYRELRAHFGSISWFRQGSQPHKDFKPLLLQALHQLSSPYILFAVDDIVVKDFVNLAECTEWLQKTSAFAFYLRLGTHIRHCYMTDQPQTLPPHLPLTSEVLAWDFRAAEHDWAFPGTLDMAIYRKADILPIFEKLQFKHPNRLEQAWAGHGVTKQPGLCFATSKIVNLPLNIVNPSDCPHSHFMSAEELLSKWSEGLKMDTSPLFQIENASPHIDYAPQFVKR